MHRARFLLLLALPACEAERQPSAAETVVSEAPAPIVVAPQPGDNLLGEYAEAPGGEPIFRVARGEQGLTIADRIGRSDWSEPMLLDAVPPREELERHYGEDAAKIEQMYVNASNGGGILRLEPGSTLAGEAFPSEYAVVVGGLPLPIYKR